MLAKTFVAISIIVTALWAGVLRAEEPHFVQTNLVSDIPGLAAITDPELVNPWGVSHSPTSPFWVSNQGNNTPTLYAVPDARKVSNEIINPPARSVLTPPHPQAPHGPHTQPASPPPPHC